MEKELKDADGNSLKEQWYIGPGCSLFSSIPIAYYFTGRYEKGAAITLDGKRVYETGVKKWQPLPGIERHVRALENEAKRIRGLMKKLRELRKEQESH